MKRKIWAAAGVLLALLLAYFIGSGFRKEPSVFVEDYAVSPDGKTITLNLGVASSVGYLRKVSVQKQDTGTLYLDTRAAFGGLNGSIGAKDVFSFPLREDTAAIALYRGSGSYETALVRAEDGSWRRPGQ